MVCHIPFSARPQLWSRVEQTLAVDGVLYIEDFFAKGEYTEVELVDLEERIGMPSPKEIPSREKWIAQLEAAGFQDVTFQDMTDVWTPWVSERAKTYRGNHDRNLRVQGKAITEGMERFYDCVASLFNGGRLGGCIVRAVKARGSR